MKNESFYLNQEKLTSDEEGQNRNAETRAVLESIIEDRARRAKKNSIEFSPEMEKFINGAKEWHEARFRDLGVYHINWGKYIFKVSETENGEHGNSGLGIIQIGDLSKEKLTPVPIEESSKKNTFLPMEVPNEILGGLPKDEAAQKLREYIEALYMVHELYHDASPMSIYIRTETDEASGERYHTTDERPYDRSGLSYSRYKKNGGNSAIEEGLAMTAQKEGEAFAAQHFPEGAKLYKDLLDYAIKTDPRLEGKPRRLLSVRNFDGEAVKYGPMQYIDGFVLTEYLAREIPNFYELAEQARVNGRVLPLARAVEEKFGRGSYKKIVTCDDHDALTLVEELRKKVEQAS